MKNNLSLLTPVDILNLHFPRRFSGYDVAEVDVFVRRVAGDMETILAESAALKERIAAQEREISQYRSLENTMRDALILAQKAADETRNAARSQSVAILQETQNRIDEMHTHIDRLRQERRRLAREIRAHLTAQLAWLDQEFDNETAPMKAVFSAAENDTTVSAVPQISANGADSVPEIAANAAQKPEDA